MTELQTEELEAQYAQAVDLESAAQHALQAQAPGTEAHGRAWQEWSAAITRTNRAWRQLALRRPGGTGAAATQAQVPQLYS